MRHTISCLARNRPGVLASVAKAFADRGVNVHSLAVNASEGENVSRLTIVIEGDKDRLDAAAEDMATLEDIKEVDDLDRGGFLDRELVLVKINTKPEDLPQVMQIIEVMGATVLAMSENTMTIEMPGSEVKISGFIRLLKPFGLLECARSGRVAVSSGEPRCSA